MAVYLNGQTGLHAVNLVVLGSSYANEPAQIHPLCMTGNLVRAALLPWTFEAA